VRRWAIVLVILAGLGLGAAARFVPGSPVAITSASPGPTGTAQAIAADSTPMSTPRVSTPRVSTPRLPTPRPTPPPLPELRFNPASLSVAATGFLAWALMDRRTGKIWGSPTMTGTTWPASMIKAWLASDFLRRATENNQEPSAAILAVLDQMIRDSDNKAAQDIYVRNGGPASIKRLITMCELTDTTASRRGWSFTNISAQDTVRMADCIGDGVAAGPAWTNWVLTKMRTVRVGDFGIRKALPAAEAATVSIKNGWLLYDDDKSWHVNCMAVADSWALAVLQRYPGTGPWASDFKQGQDVCKQVATQLMNPKYVPES
jgi:hypothetical protein